MDDTTNLNPPSVVKDLAQAASTLGFTMSSPTSSNRVMNDIIGKNECIC